jgi:hypothetical protein
MEADRLREPDVDKIFKKHYEAEDFGEEMGEYEGKKILGM